MELLHHDCHLEAGGSPVCGCTIVLKPSEYTPLTLLRVAELAKAVGIPDGVINVVNGAGGEIAQRLITHPACAKVSFTGSVATGEKSSSRPVRQVNG